MASPSSKTRRHAGYAVAGAWLCHTGRVRRVNEDSCVIGRMVWSGSEATPAAFAIDGIPWLVAVSDGIGGHRAGAEASREVGESLGRCARFTPSAVSSMILRIHRRLCARGRSNPECAGMGATVAGIACGARDLFAFSVGDSRVYKLSRDRLAQVTRDDSEAEELMRHGLLPRDGSVRPGYLHALTQAVGGRSVAVEIHPHIYPLHVTAHARFLVCSDGLTDMLPLPVLQSALDKMRDPAAAVQHLFDGAMEAGGVDNITLAVADVRRGKV